jgi:hypothetical protein
VKLPLAIDKAKTIDFVGSVLQWELLERGRLS